MARAKYAQDLIDQCFMWCIAVDQKPVKAIDRWFMEQAVSDNKFPFAELNHKQRRNIAGLALLD